VDKTWLVTHEKFKHFIDKIPEEKHVAVKPDINTSAFVHLYGYERRTSTIGKSNAYLLLNSETKPAFHAIDKTTEGFHHQANGTRQ